MPLDRTLALSEPLALPHDLSSGWKWSNNYPAKNVEITENGVKMVTSSSSDFWNKTHYGYTALNGNFLYLDQLKLTVNDNFVLQASMRGNYQKLYDQAGVMLKTNDDHWIKTGIEYVHGIHYVSAVLTREYSDWSTKYVDDLFSLIF